MTNKASTTLELTTDGVQPVTRSTRGRRFWARTARVLIVVAFVGAWQAIGTRSPVERLTFSTPESVLTTLGRWTDDATFWRDLGITLTEAVLGYLMGVGSGVALAAVVFSSTTIERFLRPFVAVFNALPKVVLAPLFLLWFGIGISSKVYFTASVIFFIIFYGAYTGMKAIDVGLVNNMRALGASAVDLTVHVYAPAILTWIVAGLRLSFTFAILATVLGEFLGGTEGLGVRISLATQQLQNNVVIAGIIAIALVAVLVDRSLVRVERRFTRWKLF